VTEMDIYLQPSELCDFDRDNGFGRRTAGLVTNVVDEAHQVEAVFAFVKELPYGLEDWDVKALETLRRGWGMCCGKTNLLVAMLRTLRIPARYKVFRIRAESKLLRWMAEQDNGLGMQMTDIPAEQDHLECEALVAGVWRRFDPSRDSALERGLQKMGIPLDRIPVVDAHGAAHCLRLASIDRWASDRQAARRFREGRAAMFARANEQLDRIRRMGKGEYGTQAG